MKPYFFLFCLFFCSCDQSKKANTTLKKNNIPQWVTYKADNNQKRKHVVLVSGDEEYRSEEALPQLAKILTEHHGFDCTVLFAQNPEKPGLIDPNYSFNIPGLAHLADADLMVLFTRFRALPKEQMEHINNFLLAGKPLVAIRTATHGFNYKDKNHPFYHYSFNYDGIKKDWHLGFGKKILGETWYTHHGQHKHQSTRGIIPPEANDHPILNGIEDGSMWGPSDVYGIRIPMGGDAQVLVLGQTIDRTGEYDETDVFYGMKATDQTIATQTPKGNNEFYNPNEKMPPIVWTKSYQLSGGKMGQSVTSTIGAATDMANEEVRRVMVNAVYHLLKLEVPQKANVAIVGQYKPSAFAFHDDEYWQKKGLQVKDFLWE